MELLERSLVRGRVGPLRIDMPKGHFIGWHEVKQPWLLNWEIKVLEERTFTQRETARQNTTSRVVKLSLCMPRLLVRCGV